MGSVGTHSRGKVVRRKRKDGGTPRGSIVLAGTLDEAFMPPDDWVDADLVVPGRGSVPSSELEAEDMAHLRATGREALEAASRDRVRKELLRGIRGHALVVEGGFGDVALELALRGCAISLAESRRPALRSSIRLLSAFEELEGFHHLLWTGDDRGHCYEWGKSTDRFDAIVCPSGLPALAAVLDDLAPMLRKKNRPRVPEIRVLQWIPTGIRTKDYRIRAEPAFRDRKKHPFRIDTISRPIRGRSVVRLVRA